MQSKSLKYSCCSKKGLRPLEKIQLNGLAKAIEEAFVVSEASLLPPDPFHQHDSLFPHLLPLLDLTDDRHENHRQSEPSSSKCLSSVGQQSQAHPGGRRWPCPCLHWLVPSLKRVQAKAKSLNLPSAAEEGLGELHGSAESYRYGIHGACCYESISHHNYLIYPFFKLDNKVECLTRPFLIHLHFLLSLAEEGSPSSIN